MTEEKCGLGEGTHFLGCECHEKLFNEAIDLLCGMVGQHCATERGLESMALRDNMAAIKFLEKIGKVKIEKEYGRMVLAKWVGEK